MQLIIDNYENYDRVSIAKKATEAFNYDTIGSQHLTIYNSILSNNKML